MTAIARSMTRTSCWPIHAVPRPRGAVADARRERGPCHDGYPSPPHAHRRDDWLAGLGNAAAPPEAALLWRARAWVAGDAAADGRPPARGAVTRQHETITVVGMELDRWTHASCTAEIAVGEDWATLYSIRSTERRQGHATTLLQAARTYYEAQGKRFGGSVALNEAMARLYRTLGIPVWEDEIGRASCRERVERWVGRGVVERKRGE